MTDLLVFMGLGSTGLPGECTTRGNQNRHKRDNNCGCWGEFSCLNHCLIIEISVYSEGKCEATMAKGHRTDSSWLAFGHHIFSRDISIHSDCPGTAGYFFFSSIVTPWIRLLWFQWTVYNYTEIMWQERTATVKRKKNKNNCCCWNIEVMVHSLHNDAPNTGSCVAQTRVVVYASSQRQI